MMKVPGVINPSRHQKNDNRGGCHERPVGWKIGSDIAKSARLDNVTWASLVTGRYDIFVEVAVTGGTQELYRFTSEIISKVGTV